MLKAIDIGTSGLIAQRHRMNTIAGNIANVHSTRDEDGNLSPFQRRIVTFTADERYPESSPDGVGVEFHVEFDTAAQPRKVHDPGHPDADSEGYVSYPNINLITEFVNALEASRAYEANVASIEISKEMANLSMRILA